MNWAHVIVGGFLLWLVVGVIVITFTDGWGPWGDGSWF